MNITQARALAQKSTQYGDYDHSATLSVDCTQCRDVDHKRFTVTTVYSMWATDGKGKRLSKIQQLRRAVLEHLLDEH